MYTIINIIFPVRCCICGNYIQHGKADYGILCRKCREPFVEGRLFSAECIICGKELVSERSICLKCRNNTPDYIKIDSLFSYSGGWKTLIAEYKFHGIRKLGYFFSQLLYERYKSTFQPITIVPVPCQISSRKKRGWDQMHFIASVLHRRFGCDVSYLLGRKRSHSQKSLSKIERQTNLKGKVYCRKRISGECSFLLIDDVCTTGATLSECASVLYSAGASSVYALTLAAVESK